MIPTKADLDAAFERIKNYVHHTPVHSSSLLNESTGMSLFFKAENFQKMGAFKMRGAVNAILQLSEAQQSAGVVTHSSGNFGQAVALAAKTLGVKAYIVMPENAPSVKREAVAAYGGEIILCESTLQAREDTSKSIQQKTGATFLHPSNQMEVILGNATATIELLTSHPNLDMIIVPVGGGGLIAGTALAAHYYAPNTIVIGGEPHAVDDAFRSLASGSIEYNETTNTVADGLRTHLGDINFPIIQKYVKEIIRVSETEIVEAMKLIYERMKIVVEPSSAVALAAILKEKERFQNKKIGIILSGGNVDVKNLPF